MNGRPIWGNLAIKAHYLLDRGMATVRSPQVVIVSGFWRSGTTWLQEVLAEAIHAKTLFEPFEPGSLMPLYSNGQAEMAAYIPFDTRHFSAADHRFLDLVFKGVSPRISGFTYLCRKSLLEPFCKRLVIKFVRAQAIMPVLIERFQPESVIHITRHPLAVVQSLLNVKWQWRFENVDFHALYETEKKLGFNTDIDLLCEYSKSRPEEKIAAFWALTERRIRRVGSVHTCSYEALLLKPKLAFTELMERAGLVFAGNVNYSKDSPVTTVDRLGSSLEQRLNSWKTNLDQQVKHNAVQVIRRCWPEAEQTWSF